MLKAIMTKTMSYKIKKASRKKEEADPINRIYPIQIL